MFLTLADLDNFYDSQYIEQWTGATGFEAKFDAICSQVDGLIRAKLKNTQWDINGELSKAGAERNNWLLYVFGNLVISELVSRFNLQQGEERERQDARREEVMGVLLDACEGRVSPNMDPLDEDGDGEPDGVGAVIFKSPADNVDLTQP